jgi:hypothetical protein
VVAIVIFGVVIAVLLGTWAWVNVSTRRKGKQLATLTARLCKTDRCRRLRACGNDDLEGRSPGSASGTAICRAVPLRLETD